MAERRNWTEPALFEGGYTQLMLEMTLHLDGPNNVAQLGYTLLDGLTREWIQAKVPICMTGVANHPALLEVIEELLADVLTKLLPF